MKREREKGRRVRLSESADEPFDRRSSMRGEARLGLKMIARVGAMSHAW